MLHAHAPRLSPRLRTFFGGAALLILLPGCPGDEVPIDDTSSSSSSSTSTPTPEPDPDSTTSEPPCGTGCPPSDTTETVGSSSSGGTTDGTGSSGTSSSGGESSSSSSGGESSSSSGGGETSSSSGGTTEGVSAGSSSSSGGEFETGVIFIVGPDLPAGSECDPWLQDCPVGEKCNPYSSGGGGSWDANACFPIDPAPVGVGETCLVQGSGTSGFDNCDFGAMCWDVDPVTNEGTCVALCTGTPAAPVCPPTSTCAIANDGVLTVCLPGCDPLLQDCVAGQACYPVGPGFTCAPDASGGLGVDGDECEFINVCDPGLMCAGPGSLEGCFGFTGCCTPFCDVSVPGDPCPAASEECVPFFEVGMAPIGFEDVGICAIPV